MQIGFDIEVTVKYFSVLLTKMTINNRVYQLCIYIYSVFFLLQMHKEHFVLFVKGTDLLMQQVKLIK